MRLQPMHLVNPRMTRSMKGYSFLNKSENKDPRGSSVLLIGLILMFLEIGPNRHFLY